MNLFLVILLSVLLSFKAEGSTLDRLISKECNSEIPTDLVAKIVTHESKSVYKGQVQAWPWVLNVNGYSYYYKTRKGVTKAALSYIRDKKNTVDIGFGQINWFFHKHRFNNDISAALIPSQNIRITCEILAEGMRDKRVTDLTDLVAYYHRPVLDKRAYLYAKKVLSH